MQAKRKRDRMGDLKIVVAGCVAQQEGEQLLRRVPEVDLVMGEPTLSTAPAQQQHSSCSGGGGAIGASHKSCRNTAQCDPAAAVGAEMASAGGAAHVRAVGLGWRLAWSSANCAIVSIVWVSCPHTCVLVPVGCLLSLLCALAGPQFANKLDQLLEQVDSNQTQLCATDHIEVRPAHMMRQWPSQWH